MAGLVQSRGRREPASITLIRDASPEIVEHRRLISRGIVCGPVRRYDHPSRRTKNGLGKRTIVNGPPEDGLNSARN